MARRVVVWRSVVLPPSETFVVNQMSGLDGWSATLVGIASEKSSLTKDVDVRICRLSRLAARTFKLSRRSRRIRKVIRKLEPEVIHAHFGFDAVLIEPIARSLGVPMVVTYHGSDVTSFVHGRNLQTLLYRRRLKALLRRHVHLPVSNFVSQRLLDLGGDQTKIRVHYIGVPQPARSTSAPYQSERRCGVLFVGRLVKKKGVEDLLRAVSSLEKGGLSTPVTIIGDGPCRSELEALALALEIDATFEGKQPPDRVERAMSEAAVFCGPSRKTFEGDGEGFGLVFAEAQSHGVPVVSYKQGGIVEAVEHGVTGLLADEGDVAGLAHALHEVLTNTSLSQQMGLAARERASADHSLNKQLRILERIYEDVASGTHS